MRIYPSILNADWLHLGDVVAALGAAGADALHLDVMDGHFVPNLSFGPAMVAALHRQSGLALDCHLMIGNAEAHWQAYAQAGARAITVHVEACQHLHRLLAAIKAQGLQTGVALNPATPPQSIAYCLPLLSHVLVMTVNPGFGGQSYLREAAEKLRVLRDWQHQGGLEGELVVDGGIDAVTIAHAAGLGAQACVVGNYLWQQPDLHQALQTLRKAAKV